MEHRFARNGVMVAMLEWDRLPALPACQAENDRLEAKLIRCWLPAAATKLVPNTGWKPMPLLKSDIRFANDPYQMIRMAKHILSGTSKQDSCNATLALRAKHDQVGVVLLGKASDLRTDMIGLDHPRRCSDSL